MPSFTVLKILDDVKRLGLLSKIFFSSECSPCLLLFKYLFFYFFSCQRKGEYVETVSVELSAAFSMLKKVLDESGFDVEEAFEAADEDEHGFSDGTATYEEFKDMLVMIADFSDVKSILHLTEEQVQLIIQHVDRDNLGTLNLKEFQLAMESNITREIIYYLFFYLFFF